MKKSKKVLVIALLAIVVLAGSIGGVVLAADNETEAQPGANREAILQRVCEIYEQNTGTAIDPDQLQTAFEQAGQEQRDAALDDYLNKLVEEGRLTSDEAQQYKDWIEARPDVPLALGPGGPGGIRHFGGMRGFGGGFGIWDGPPCAPETPEA